MEFICPENLNGFELRNELRLAGFNISDEPNSVRVIGNKLILDIEGSLELANNVIENHNGNTVVPEPTIADKLASVGLSLDELKAAILGGN